MFLLVFLPSKVLKLDLCAFVLRLKGFRSGAGHGRILSPQDMAVAPGEWFNMDFMSLDPTPFGKDYSK